MSKELRTTECKYDHDNVSLKPDEVAKSMCRAIQGKTIEKTYEIGDTDRKARDPDGLVRQLVADPNQEILGVEKEEESQHR